MSSSQPDRDRSDTEHERWIAEARGIFERLRSRAANAPTIARRETAPGDPPVETRCRELQRGSEAERAWLAASELASGLEKLAVELRAGIASELAALYDARGEPAKAAEWRAKTGTSATQTAK